MLYTLYSLYLRSNLFRAMKRVLIVALLFALLSVKAHAETTPEATSSRGALHEIIPGDGVLRFYRLAIPITLSSYEEDLDGDYNKVLKFWQECEDFVNSVFIPLGFCFDVVTDNRLVMTERNVIDDDIYAAPAYGTELLNEAIGTGAYDVGMWVTHRDIYAENSGLSVESGVYSNSTKGSGYAKTDKWVVAHEIGHLFGAPHTPTGEGSLMDTEGKFFAYPSIKTIRTKSSTQNAAYYVDESRTTLSGTNAGGNYVYGIKVNNTAPRFDAATMKETYKIPQGACLSLALNVNDAEDHRLMYSAVGCNSSNVDMFIEGGDLPPFASMAPGESRVIEYSPKYSRDIFYEDYFYPVDGTNVPEMQPGTYSISMLVNDMPAEGISSSDALKATPFYSYYDVWEAKVEIVSGTPFTAELSPVKTEYSAGEQITVTWGVNRNYFNADSRLRITMSDDYGKTFKYVLAESVPALDGQCTVKLPDANVGMVNVDFITAFQQMRGGIVRVEEIGGAAFAPTSLSPEDGTSFIVTGVSEGGSTSIDGISASIDEVSVRYYDLSGRPVAKPATGFYIERKSNGEARVFYMP